MTLNCNRLCTYFGRCLNFKILCRKKIFLTGCSGTKHSSGTKAVLIILLVLLYTFCNYADLNLWKGYNLVQYSGDTYYGPCMLPVLNPFDPAMMKDQKKMEPINCEGSAPIVFIDSKNILQFNKTALNLLNIIPSTVQCKCSEIIRTNADNTIKISEPMNCTPPFDFKSDFIKVYCDIGGSSIYANVMTKVHRQRYYKSLGNGTYNVLLFGLDTVSRSNAFREIPQTVEFLTKKLRAFDFHGYMKVGDNTFPNIVPLLTGREAFSSELPSINYNEDFFDEFPFIWKTFAAKDYVTLYAEDMPHMNTFNLGKKGFRNPPTDHYMRPYWLAWHDVYKVRKYKAGLLMNMLNNDFIKSKMEQYTMCAGNVPNYIAHLKYLNQFIDTYPDERKFMFSFITELAHNNNNLLHLSDTDLKRFFEELHNSNTFSNTILIVFSDHGPKTGDRILEARLEKSLPMLFIVVPKSLRESYPSIVQNMQDNEKRLTTHYDVYTTLLDIVNGNFASPSKHRVNGAARGYSLFGVIPATRSCAEAAIPEHFCVCYKAKHVSTENNKMIDKMADVVVAKINQFLSGNSMCALLQLNTILSVQQISEGSFRETSPHVIRPKPQTDVREKYTITIETLPGKGHFYATVVKEGSIMSVLDDIDRVNRYNNQSYCVKEHKLRPLCYCKVQ